MSFDPLIERDFLDAATCGRLVAEMSASRSAPATVYGRAESGAVDERMRRTTRVFPSAETEVLVRRLLLARMGAADAHFGRRLCEVEEPQFLLYGVGGHFVAHQDGNTGLLRSERESRRVSAVVFLNTQAEAPGPGAYGGGSLVFHPRGAGEPSSLTGEAGTLVLFRAETTHEVTPVTHGRRFTVASWYR
ncbi:MAG: 2OG-Fe(II) oxygenase [Acidobacteria bacterium]|nr:2OG-Fe(II) oxygenase [Acidobacteriota bacterium]